MNISKIEEMKSSDDIKKELLFEELHKCLNSIRGYADFNSLLMPLLYILYAHNKGHLVSIIGDAPNFFSGEKHIQPLLDQDMNDVESDLLKRIRLSVDERYFRGKTVQIIFDFYSRCAPLITQFYPELIEYIFSMYSSYSGKYYGMFATPKEITKIMYHLAIQGNVKTIYDPCAGLCSGVLLDEMNDVKFIGQEINEQIKLFADIRLDAHKKQVTLFNEDVSRIWRGEKSDCLCSDLPIGVKVDDYSSNLRCKISIEEYVLWNFINTFSIKRAVVLVPLSFCFNKSSFNLRKTMLDRNFVDTIIQFPAGILPNTGANTAIIVLNKERISKEVRLVLATDCFTKDNKKKILDTTKLLSRLEIVSHDQTVFCGRKQFSLNDYSFIPSHYILTHNKLLAGQKIVKFLEVATEIRNNTHFNDIEGYQLTERQMCGSIAEFHTFENKMKIKPLPDAQMNKLTKPCIIFNNRANKFFIKKDETPLFVSLNYRAFEVDTKKCLPEYLVYVVLKSEETVKSVMISKIASRIDYKKLSISIFDNLETQRQIIEREYRQEAKLLRKKLERLQTLSGQSSDLLHNLGVTFTRLDAAVSVLQRRNSHDTEYLIYKQDSDDYPMDSTIKMIDDNIKYALRLINSTGADFSKATPIMRKVLLEKFINDYIESWSNFGYSTFSILQLKSEIPQTKVEIDPDLIYTAIDCLLINAHQHGFLKRGQETNFVQIELKAVILNDKKYAVISVSNNGEPLPDGFTIQDFAARGVVGLNSCQDGLGGHHIVSIAHLHNGFVGIETSTEWLSFHILLPTYINGKNTIFNEFECEFL